MKQLVVKRNDFSASDEYPYTCTLEGCSIISVGATEDEAIDSFIDIIIDMESKLNKIETIISTDK